MDNLIVRIVLPQGLALKNNQYLIEDTTFEIVGHITPWYCSVDQVKLEGGPYIRGLSDITISAMIYQHGRTCDAITTFAPQPPQPSGTAFATLGQETYQRFLLARQRYVQLKATKDLMLNLWDVNVTRGSKTLGNFSVSQVSQTKDEEVPKKLTTLEKDIKDWEIVVRSAGKITVGGRVLPTAAAKGLYDVDYPAGRMWMTTGMGANRKSIAGYGSNGKPVKFGSNPIIQWRVGRYTGGYMSVIPSMMFTGC